MDIFAQLALGDGPLMLIAPPDGVLAAAGGRSPRPSFASSIEVAEPAPQIVWWVEAETFGPGPLRKLRWLLESSRGTAWVILDPDDGPTPGDATALLAAAGVRVLEERALGRDCGLRVAPAQ